ncbi:FAD-dependent oxidoreductase [Microbacterium album]|uniref:FAD-dependent oxidoreductase 2 FAD-binding domain-containing protein n=1 Tax=Microbacterium album TaxID=2053191 RepID=A0A917IFG5_9MICO|nr:FAD-dependent oxidoreductase [Microbacterium album]GGH48484.1 hypothetical protein GCM10010921_25970 [Microbacterium album]
MTTGTTTTADLVVVGAGSAGAATAIAARDAGAEVVLLEKSAAAGGNSRYSAGNLIEFTGPGGLDHLRALCFGRTPDSVLAAYLAGLGDIRGWLEGLGARTITTGPTDQPGPHANCWPHLPGAEDVQYYAIEPPGSQVEELGLQGAGPALWGVLEAALDERGVVPQRGARVVSLLRDGARVTGVTYRREGREYAVHARAGVVLATGGFQGDPHLCETYLPLGAAAVASHPDSTGDGMLLAMEAGADLWHMSNGFGFWSHVEPQFRAAFPIAARHPAHLLVDQGGYRFAAETGRETHDRLRIFGDFRPDRPNVPALPAFLIFDARLLAAGPLSLPSTAGASGYLWSADNAAELASGWITAAETVEELAAKLGIPAARLAATVAEYGKYAEAGLDPDFGRPAATMRPLGYDGPYYAISVVPGVLTAAGGPRRDAHGRTLDRSGRPIPGLYSVGDNGSIWGHIIQHGLSLTDGLVFGRICAEHALAAFPHAPTDIEAVSDEATHDEATHDEARALS